MRHVRVESYFFEVWWMCSFLSLQECVGHVAYWGIDGVHIPVCEISGLLESSVYGLNGRISDGTDPLLCCVVMEIYVNCLSGV